MPYTVAFATSALRDLERLPAQIVQRVLNAARELEQSSTTRLQEDRGKRVNL